MKIAIMLSGQPRFNREFSDLLVNLRNYDQIDIFLYLWNSDPAESVFIPPTWPIDPDSIRSRIQANIPTNAQIASLQILSQPTYNVTKSYNLTPWSNPTNIWYTFYGIKQVNTLKEEYEKIHGAYDFAIRARPDAGLRDPVDCYRIKEYLDSNPSVVIMPDNRRFGLQGNPVNDLIGIGTGNAMSTYCSAIDYFDQYNDQGTLYHPETLLSRHLTTNNIQFPSLGVICTFREHWHEHNRPDYGVWI
jgi:hypothetical protein